MCSSLFYQVDGWDSDPADVDLYDRDDVDWDGQFSSGRKRRSGRDFLFSADSFSRRHRKSRMETQEEINQRMRSVELAVKEALSARGDKQFTDQEFPPNDRSLFVDTQNPPSKLQVGIVKFFFFFCYWLIISSLCNYFWTHGRLKINNLNVTLTFLNLSGCF